MNFVQPIRDPAKIAAIEEYLLERNRRNWLLFVAGIHTGLRISDLLPLRVGDVRGKEHLVIKEKKTGKRSWTLVTPRLRKVFKDYTKNLDDQCYLFRGREGGNKPISRARAYQVLRQAARAHGIENIGCHSMRKTFGWFFYKQFKDVAMLQSIFNHSHPSVTLKYIGLQQDHMDANMSKFVIKT